MIKPQINTDELKTYHSGRRGVEKYKISQQEGNMEEKFQPSTQIHKIITAQVNMILVLRSYGEGTVRQQVQTYKTFH
uniref:Uncharacterized protein n=1 Tax=[Tolypothrix] sp. PCC 7415 TaxID=373957 RepID=A0A2P0ZGA2_9CYAN|nr:hypothetical protein [[Tolypothrix] sp. PCC 7415]